jgi:hypothetical protein
MQVKTTLKFYKGTKSKKKPTLKFHPTPLRISVIKKTKSKFWEEYGGEIIFLHDW